MLMAVVLVTGWLNGEEVMAVVLVTGGLNGEEVGEYFRVEEGLTTGTAVRVSGGGEEG
jgi:hypothetical protein